MLSVSNIQLKLLWQQRIEYSLQYVCLPNWIIHASGAGLGRDGEAQGRDISKAAIRTCCCRDFASSSAGNGP